MSRPPRTRIRHARWLIALALPLAFGQTQPEPESRGAVFRVTSSLVQIDAVVDDSKSRPAPNLVADDFEIFADGKPQKIAHFSYVRVSAPSALRAPAANPGSTRDLPPEAAVPVRAEDVRRTIVLMVDDLGLSFDSMASVRHALGKFVDRQMQPGDLVAICRTGAGSGNLQQFTTDKRLLKSVAGNLRWNPNGRAGLSVFEPIGTASNLAQQLDGSGPRQPGAAILAQTSGDRAAPFPWPDSTEKLRKTALRIGTLQSIAAVVDALRNMPGRKSLVLFSDGFILQGGNVVDTLEALIDRVNRAGTVIYTIDARGLDPLQIEAQDRVDLSRAAQIDQVNETLQGLRDEKTVRMVAGQQGMASLASRAGGRSFENGNDMNWDLDRVLEDQQGYYLLGFVPPADLFNGKNGSRPFHSIQVRVKEKGFSVRSRSGFFGATDEEMKPKYDSPVEEMRVAMLDPFGKSDIGLRLTPLYSEGLHGAIVRNLIHVDAGDLKFRDNLDGSGTAELDVLAAVYGAGDRALELVSNSKEVTIAAAGRERVLRDGLVYVLDVPLKKRGPYQIRAAVRDEGTGKYGAAYQYLDVPDVKKARLALTSIVLENGATPLAGSRTLGISAARREFQPGAELDYFSVIETAEKGNLTARIRILRDGKEIYAAPAKLTSVGGGKAILGKLRLGSEMTAGDYYLELIAFDPAAHKPTVAWQWSDFQVLR